MNIIQALLQAGARELVAVLAEESVARRSTGLKLPGRSALSRGIGMIRKAFPELTQGQRGYEAARNVFRMQERRASQARQAMADALSGQDREPPRVPRSPRNRPAQERTYTLRVEIVSQRGARSSWMIVRVHAPDGTSLSTLRTLAASAVQDRVDAGTESGVMSASLGERRRIGDVQWIG